MSNPKPVYYFDAASQTLRQRTLQSLDDLLKGAAGVRVWGHFGWRDARASTKRTLLGPLWGTVSTIIQVSILAVVYGNVFNRDLFHMFLYLSCGLSLWSFIATSFFNSFDSFTHGKAFILSRDIPLSFSLFRSTLRDFLMMVFKLLSFVFFVIIARFELNAAVFLALPGLLLLILAAMPVRLFFSVVGARFHDLQFIINPLSLAAFLATPVLWERSRLVENTWIADLNPFTHLLSIVRDPLLGHVPDLMSYAIVITITVIAWIVSIITFTMNRNHIPTWL